MNKEKKKWYEKKVLVLLLLLLLFPVGFYGLVKNQGFKKYVKIILGIIFGLWFLIFAVALFSPAPSNERTNTAISNDVSTKEVLLNIEDVPAETQDKFLPGLQPVDVYQNLTSQGFSKEMNVGTETDAIWWVCKMSITGIDYDVQIYTTDVNKVESVEALAIIDVTKKEIIAVQQFIIYISSLPYENSNPTEVADWIIQNFNNDKAIKVIGDVKFTIYAPSLALRMLRVEKNL